MHGVSIVDATIIAAGSWAKSACGDRDIVQGIGAGQGREPFHHRQAGLRAN